jgi:pseudoazurin
MKSSVHFFKVVLFVLFVFLYLNYPKNSYSSFESTHPVTWGGIQVSDFKNNNVTLFWTKATDDKTPKEKLEYRVYFSRKNLINSVDEIKKNGTAASGWKKDINSFTLKNLPKNYTYHFNVLVKDGDGNISNFSRNFVFFGKAKRTLDDVKKKAVFKGVVHEVLMLNVGSDGSKMVFEPEIVYIKKGEAVKFIPKDKGHNVMLMTEKGSSPEGTDAWEGKINKEYLQVFDKEGIYGVKCKPHYAMGMVGGVVVGSPSNYNQFKSVKFKNKVQARMSKILGKIQSKLKL